VSLLGFTDVDKRLINRGGQILKVAEQAMFIAKEPQGLIDLVVSRFSRGWNFGCGRALFIAPFLLEADKAIICSSLVFFATSNVILAYELLSRSRIFFAS
jgi:hypothetical protein